MRSRTKGDKRHDFIDFMIEAIKAFDQGKKGTLEILALYLVLWADKSFTIPLIFKLELALALLHSTYLYFPLPWWAGFHPRDPGSVFGPLG